MNPLPQIQNPTRICAATGRALGPGDAYHAVLTEDDGQFVRRDYAVDAWPGPPTGAIAHWQARIPTQEPKRRLSINDELLLECLLRLADTTEPAKLNFRYVVALLLLRRKRLRFDDTRRIDGQDVMMLTEPKSGTTFQVADPRLSEAELVAVQDDMFRVLEWD
jgi:hypothetical protein